MLIALAGCVELPTKPEIVLAGEAATVEAVEGAQAWEAIGFRVAETSTAPICPRDWAAQMLIDCQIAITVIWDTERTHGGLANHELRRIRIGIETSSVANVAAHEVGHLVLDTPDHLAPNRGVMSIGPTGAVLTVADRVFACSHLGDCNR